VLDPYGLSSPPELWAVAVEAFFQDPVAVATGHRDLYAFLASYFNQDPAAWVTRSRPPKGGAATIQPAPTTENSKRSRGQQQDGPGFGHVDVDGFQRRDLDVPDPGNEALCGFRPDGLPDIEVANSQYVCSRHQKEPACGRPALVIHTTPGTLKSK
jgi:hypothetical protein